MRGNFKGEPGVFVFEPIPKAKGGRKRKKGMDLQKAIKLVEAEYEKATQLEYVYNPLAFALYQVWKIADGRAEQ